MKKWLCIIIITSLYSVICCGRGYSYLTIDTNNLKPNDESVTNIEAKSVPEPETPNIYLKTKKIEKIEPETPARRYDIVFFVAIPITFYVTLNLLTIKNQFVNNFQPLDNSDWNYIYLNTLLVPLTIAYYDYIYMEEQKKMREELVYGQKNQNNFHFNLSLISLRF